MKPKAGTIRHRIPNLDESDYKWLEEVMMGAIDVESHMYYDEFDGRLVTKVDLDEIRTHIKELFGESK